MQAITCSAPVQRGQLDDETQGVHDDVGGAVAEGVLELLDTLSPT